MRETKSPRAHRTDRHRPINRTFGPAGEAPNDRAEFDAAAEWLAHVQAGRIGVG